MLLLFVTVGLLAAFSRAVTADESIAADIQQMVDQGAKLPATFEKESNTLIQHQAGEVKSALAKQQVPAKVTEELNKVVQNYTNQIQGLVKNESTQVANLTKNYETLLNYFATAKSASSGDEEKIHVLRQQEQQLLSEWEKSVQNIQQDARTEFETKFRALAQQTAKEAANPHAGDKLREAVTAAGQKGLEELNDGQADYRHFLTGRQFDLVQNYTQNAESLLLQLYVEAKTVQQ